MGKLLGSLMTLIAAICVATVISAAVLGAYYAQSWKVTRDRFAQAVAILQGKSLDSLLPPAPPKAKEQQSEQPGYDQVLNAQSLKARDLEQRELTLRANTLQFQEELNKIVEEKGRIKAVSEDLDHKLEDIRTSTTNAGAETVRETLETVKPKQAKEFIKQLLDKGQVDVVAAMLTGMPDNKRAKIIAEFKDAREQEQIGEVLEKIRKGQPTTDVIDDTGKKLQSPAGQGS